MKLHLQRRHPALAESPITYSRLLYDHDCSDSPPPNYQQFAYETGFTNNGEDWIGDRIVNGPSHNRKELRRSLSGELHQEYFGQRFRIFDQVVLVK